MLISKRFFLLVALLQFTCKFVSVLLTRFISEIDLKMFILCILIFVGVTQSFPDLPLEPWAQIEELQLQQLPSLPASDSIAVFKTEYYEPQQRWEVTGGYLDGSILSTNADLTRKQGKKKICLKW